MVRPGRAERLFCTGSSNSAPLCGVKNKGGLITCEEWKMNVAKKGGRG
jgi:hypothetical protein